MTQRTAPITTKDEKAACAFWNDASLPESKEVYGCMAQFFLKNLKR